MVRISEQIKNGKILVSDGAWGTFLQQKGLKPGQCPELWNLIYPESVLEIAQSYIDAGSDMIETNSFGGNRYKLQLFNIEDRVFEINRAAAEISRKAAGKNKHVLGSVGPTGKMIMTGEVSFDDLYEAFKEQCIALDDGGADTIVVETMSDMEEAKAAVKAAKENTSCEIVCTMTFEASTDGGFYTMMGVTPAQMVDEIINAGADIIGANCGNGIKGMVGITDEIRKVNKNIPILIHANAGMPIYEDGKTIFPETPDEMASYVMKLINAGANIIGGCCGTTPQHIRKISEIVRSIN